MQRPYPRKPRHAPKTNPPPTTGAAADPFAPQPSTQDPFAPQQPSTSKSPLEASTTAADVREESNDDDGATEGLLNEDLSANEDPRFAMTVDDPFAAPSGPQPHTAHVDAFGDNFGDAFGTSGGVGVASSAILSKSGAVYKTSMQPDKDIPLPQGAVWLTSVDATVLSFDWLPQRTLT